MFKIWITFGAGVAWLFSACAGLASGEDAFVSKNRDQEIAGIKTFSGQLRVTGNLQATSPTTTHLMASFGNDNVYGSSGVGLLLYTSRDGVHYTPTSKRWLYEVAVDGVYPTFRDPKILKVDDTFYCAFTAMYPYASPTYSAKFGMIRSKDLIHWTNVTTPDMAAQLAASTGSAYIWHSGFQRIDGTLYVLANTADNPAHNYAVPFYPSSTGTDTFGAPIKITGTFPNTKCTASGIVKIGSVYHLHGTDYAPTVGANINVYHMTSSSPFSGYAGASLILNHAEGAPTLVTNLDGTPYVTPAGKYRLNLHQFSPDRGVLVDTADFVTYSSPVPTVPTNADPSYVSGFHVTNVGLTVANDLQTEQVLSALERDVLANKAGLYGSNTFVANSQTLAATTSTGSPVLYVGDPSQPSQTGTVVLGGAGRLYIGPISNSVYLDESYGLRYHNYLGDVQPFTLLDASLVIAGAGRGVTFASGAKILSGSGSPESAVAAPVGSLYLRSDGGAGTTLYVKQSGAGNTGWVGK